jgi:hypothetical protein
VGLEEAEIEMVVVLAEECDQWWVCKNAVNLQVT